MITLALLLAAINQVFSMLDPLFFGKMYDIYAVHPFQKGQYIMEHIINENGKAENRKIFHSSGTRTHAEFVWGVLGFLGILMGVAMVSRIAKAFQDYAVNVIVQKFGATIFTDGLKHSMKLPYQDFEDQRSGETLSILTKVRADTEKFIGYFINVLFGILVGIVVVSVYAFSKHWSIMPTYIVGIAFLSWLTNVLSRKIKNIQKNIVKELIMLAGTTTESLRNIELVKSLGLTNQEIKRLNNNTYKILGLELRKVKSIRAFKGSQAARLGENDIVSRAQSRDAPRFPPSPTCRVFEPRGRPEVTSTLPIDWNKAIHSRLCHHGAHPISMPFPGVRKHYTVSNNCSAIG